MAIDKDLSYEKEALKNIVKLLLLGPSESGKSTVLKQFQLVYGSGFTSADRVRFKTLVLVNIIQCAKTLVSQMKELEIPFGFSPLEDGAGGTLVPLPEGAPRKHDPIAAAAQKIFRHEGEYKKKELEPFVDLVHQIRPGFGLLGDETLNYDELQAIQRVWKDPGIQYCYSRANDFQLIDSCAYFLNELARFFESEYLPTDQDILNCRLMTMAVTETRFKVEEKEYRVFDVGGQRSEREKWTAYFDDVTAIIFVVAVSGYDQVCFEDNLTNRITEALNLFATICNHPLFKFTPMILFLNKQDIFKHKLQKGSLVSDHFPDFVKSNNFEHASQYFKTKFEALNKYSKKKVYSYFTWATDMEQAKNVLDTVYVVVLRFSLRNIGFM